MREAIQRSYGEVEAERYRNSRHGPDGKLFLDPRISTFLRDSSQQMILDIGMGAGPVAIEAIQKGASFVYGIDNSPAMIERAEKAIWEAGLPDRISAKVGDASSLSFPNNSFRRIMSVNVGCNLDETTLSNHLGEMQRVVTPDGKILFTAPINLGEIFTNGQLDWKQLQLLLTKINNEFTLPYATEQEVIQNNLGDLDSLHRGTFVVRDGKLFLVTNSLSKLPEEIRKLTVSESELQEGEAIWRKLPGLVVPNNYHSQAAYEMQMRQSGLRIVERNIDNFSTEGDRESYKKSISSAHPEMLLGSEYIGKGPFAVYILEKEIKTSVSDRKRFSSRE